MMYNNDDERADIDVIKSVINGNKDDFSVLVTRYKNLVYSVIYRMINDKDEAADLAQDVFIKVYKNLDKYSTEYKFSTWIMKITTNRVIDYRRLKKQDTVDFDSAPEVAATEQTPEESLVARERREKIWGAVSDLPNMYKVPIVLYHQQGLSYQEIADITGIPLSKVKNRIFRGRKMLKDSLTQGLKVREAYGM